MKSAPGLPLGGDGQYVCGDINISGPPNLALHPSRRVLVLQLSVFVFQAANKRRRFA